MGRRERALEDFREIFRRSGDGALDHSLHLIETWCVAGGPNDVRRRVALVLGIARKVYPPEGRLPEQATEREAKARLLAVLGAMNEDVQARKMTGARKG